MSDESVFAAVGEAARCAKLNLGVVDPYHAGSAPCEPRGNIGGAASQLDSILVGELLRKNLDL